MSIIHTLVAHAAGGLRGIQASQRDWSPFLAHFTCYAHMAPIRDAIRNSLTPTTIRTALQAADNQSYSVIVAIARDHQLKASNPRNRVGVAPCVCTSESTISGLIALSERYGRFGIGFTKEQFYDIGGRPCIYIDDRAYGYINKNAQAGDPDARYLLGFANVFRPPGTGLVQDFTLEREWRVFDTLDLNATPPTFVLCPEDFYDRVRALFPTARVIPLDTLFNWGA